MKKNKKQIPKTENPTNMSAERIAHRRELEQVSAYWSDQRWKEMSQHYEKYNL